MITTFLVFSYSCLNEYTENHRSYSIYNHYLEVYNCFFTRFGLLIGNGGVIYVNNSLGLEVHDSMFYNCNSSGYGGAIYSFRTNVTINRVCANSCQGSHGHFMFFTQEYDASFVSIFNYVSLSLCAPKTNGYNTLNFQIRQMYLDNHNHSKNNAYSGSCMYLNCFEMFNFSFCNIFENRASYSICIRLSGSSNNQIRYWNIIDNNSPSNSGVLTFETYNSYVFSNCIIHSNSNSLFSIGSYSTVTLSKCALYHLFTTKTGSGTFSTQSLTLTKKATYLYSYFASYLCDAVIPLTPNPTRTLCPSPTLEMTQTSVITVNIPIGKSPFLFHIFVLFY